MAAPRITYTPEALDRKAADLFWETLTRVSWDLAPGNGMPGWEELSVLNKNVWREKARGFLDEAIGFLYAEADGK